MIDEQQATRMAAFEALLDRYEASPSDFDEDVEEDIRPYFEDGKFLDRWCVVTKHYDAHFFYPEYSTPGLAQARAEHYTLDDIYEELPVEIVNLDTGDRIGVYSVSFQWRPIS